MHVHHDADARVDACQLLDADDGGGEVHACAPVLFWDLDAHQALLEGLFDDARVHHLGLVHLPYLGQDVVLGELGHGLAHHGLCLGQV